MRTKEERRLQAVAKVATFVAVTTLVACRCDPNRQVGPEDHLPLPDFPVASCSPAGQVQSAEQETSSCVQGPTEVTVFHDPLYSTLPHTSTITAVGRNSESGIASIHITVTVGRMTDCTETGTDPPSEIPCRAGATATIHECTYSGTPEIGECTREIAIEDGSLISYHAMAMPVTGAPAFSRTITYSGGQPMEHVAAPIWWHTDMPSRSLPESQINLAIFPDADFNGDMAAFSNDVSWIVRNAFLNTSQQFSTKYTANRHFFNVWAVPFSSADAQDCARSFPEELMTIDGLMGKAIFHKGGFNDCATVSAGKGDGSVGVTNELPDWLLVHESAHFLFGLADEYGTPGAAAVSEPPNTFETQPGCKHVNATLFANANQCVTFGAEPSYKWRVDSGPSETMRDREYTSAFKDTSDVAINNRLAKCLSGQCY